MIALLSQPLLLAGGDIAIRKMSKLPEELPSAYQNLTLMVLAAVYIFSTDLGFGFLSSLSRTAWIFLCFSCFLNIMNAKVKAKAIRHAENIGDLQKLAYLSNVWQFAIDGLILKVDYSGMQRLLPATTPAPPPATTPAPHPATTPAPPPADRHRLASLGSALALHRRRAVVARPAARALAAAARHAARRRVLFPRCRVRVQPRVFRLALETTRLQPYSTVVETGKRTPAQPLNSRGAALVFAPASRSVTHMQRSQPGMSMKTAGRRQHSFPVVSSLTQVPLLVALPRAVLPDARDTAPRLVGHARLPVPACRGGGRRALLPRRRRGEQVTGGGRP